MRFNRGLGEGNGIVNASEGKPESDAKVRADSENPWLSPRPIAGEAFIAPREPVPAGLPDRHPVLGWYSGLVILVLAAISSGLGHLAGWSGIAATRPMLVGYLELVGMGAIYGTLTATVWVCSLVDRRWLRHGMRIGLVLVVAGWINVLSSTGWMRATSNLGFLALAQCTIFFLCKVPSWSPTTFGPAASPATRGKRSRQFQIADVFFATGAVAGLLGLVTRYVTPITAWQYWLVLLADSIATPFVSVCLIAAVFRTRLFAAGIAMAAVSFALALLTAVGISFAQATMAVSVPISSLFPLYGSFLAGSWIAMTIAAMAGRRQWILDSKYNVASRNKTASVGSGSGTQVS